MEPPPRSSRGPPQDHRLERLVKVAAHQAAHHAAGTRRGEPALHLALVGQASLVFLPFAQGALRAASFMIGKPAGYYDMKDLLSQSAQKENK